MRGILNKVAENKNYLFSLAMSILLAFFLGGLLMAVTGYNPADGYAAMLKGAFGSSRVFGNTLAKMLTLCLTGLATAVGAKAGLFNVGGEGQLYLGGMAATIAGIYLCGLPAAAVVPLAFLSAMAAGGLYAWIPAVLKVKMNVSEVITTIMLNSVAIYFCSWLCNGPLQSADKGIASGTDAVADSYLFGQVIARSNLSTAIFYSAVIAFFCWYIMEKTSTGLEMKVTGENPRFAFFSGLKKDKIMIWSMVASGAICGLVGMFEVYGYQHRFLPNISNDFFFDGMLVAMIMNYSPLGIILMSLFFAVIDIGASAMELSTGISHELSDIIFAIIIFLMAAEGGISRALSARRLQRKARAEIGSSGENRGKEALK